MHVGEDMRDGHARHVACDVKSEDGNDKGEAEAEEAGDGGRLAARGVAFLRVNHLLLQFGQPRGREQQLRDREEHADLERCVVAVEHIRYHAEAANLHNVGKQKDGPLQHAKGRLLCAAAVAQKGAVVDAVGIVVIVGAVVIVVVVLRTSRYRGVIETVLASLAADNAERLFDARPRGEAVDAVQEEDGLEGRQARGHVQEEDAHARGLGDRLQEDVRNDHARRGRAVLRRGVEAAEEVDAERPGLRDEDDGDQVDKADLALVVVVVALAAGLFDHHVVQLVQNRAESQLGDDGADQHKRKEHERPERQKELAPSPDAIAHALHLLLLRVHEAIVQTVLRPLGRLVQEDVAEAARAHAVGWPFQAGAVRALFKEVAVVLHVWRGGLLPPLVWRSLPPLALLLLWRWLFLLSMLLLLVEILLRLVVVVLRSVLCGRGCGGMCWRRRGGRQGALRLRFGLVEHSRQDGLVVVIEAGHGCGGAGSTSEQSPPIKHRAPSGSR
eukprot:m.205681 g.205681  ORF g.205681 m.205681 type:complete len:499 (-) comp17763_c0_seq1:106-1602(-)